MISVMFRHISLFAKPGKIFSTLSIAINNRNDFDVL